MKKLFIYPLLVTAVLFVITCTIWAIQNPGGGAKLTTSWRFHKMEDSAKVFNWFGVLSPLQFEAKKETVDTVHIKERVLYPVAPTFSLVEPRSTDAENVVASKIAKVITDSVANILFNKSWDYDGTSVAVWNVHNTSQTVGTKPELTMSLFGTASPEAEKYGFEKSITPGHKEPENEMLAKARLKRTSDLVLQKLSRAGIKPTQAPKLQSEELQLQKNQVDSVIKDKTLLNKMRYVDVNADIVVHRTTITPYTFPIIIIPALLLTWFISWLLSLIRFPKREQFAIEHIEPVHTYVESVEPIRESTPINWARVLRTVVITIGIFFVLYALYTWTEVVLYILVITLITYLIYRYSREVWGRMNLWWKKLRRYWPKRGLCQFLVIWFLITSIGLIIALICWLLNIFSFCT